MLRGELVGEAEVSGPMETVPASPGPDEKGGARVGEGEGTRGSPVQSAEQAAAEGGGRGAAAVGEGEGGGKDQSCVAERVPTASQRWLVDHTSPSKKGALPDNTGGEGEGGDGEGDGGEGEGEGGEGEEAEESLAAVDRSARPPPSKRKRRWIAELPKSETQAWVNHNQHSTDNLEELVQAVKKHPTVTSCEEVYSVLALKAEEISARGGLGKAEESSARGGLRRLEAVDQDKQAILSSGHSKRSPSAFSNSDTLQHSVVAQQSELASTLPRVPVKACTASEYRSSPHHQQHHQHLLESWDTLTAWLQAHAHSHSKNGTVGEGEGDTERKSVATRHLILIRHGQYQQWPTDSDRKKLTELGRRQARATGERLKQLDANYNSLYYSTMPRATETGKIIRCLLYMRVLHAVLLVTSVLPVYSECLPGVPTMSCDLIREVAPYPPDPPSKLWRPEQNVRG